MSYVNLPTEKLIIAIEKRQECLKRKQKLNNDTLVEYKTREFNAFRRLFKWLGVKQLTQKQVHQWLEDNGWLHSWRDRQMDKLFDICIAAKKNNIEFVSVSSEDYSSIKSEYITESEHETILDTH